MSLTRKVLRFGKPLPLIKGIIDRFKAHEKKPVRNILLRTLADFFLIMYFVSDHPLYFQRIGFVKMDKSWVDFIDYQNNLYWLLECVIDLYCDLVDLYYIHQEILSIVSYTILLITVSHQINEQRASLRSAVESGDKSSLNVADAKDKLKELHTKWVSVLLSIVRGGADLPVIFHFMGSTHISSGMGGFLGTISSSVSLYNLWGK